MILPDTEVEAIVRRLLEVAPGQDLDLLPLSKRGSERNFFRCVFSAGPLIAVNYSPVREENTHFVGIALFLRDIGVSVPRIIADDPERHVLVMEDLGDADLWSFRDKDWEARRGLYAAALAGIQILHKYPAERAAVTTMPGFGPGLYRWERDYFRENFVEKCCGLKLSISEAACLEDELERLAARMASVPLCLIHRDFQSQNIMIRNGKVFFIDFQGMRPGSPFYDLGSLLYDPYVPFTEDQRMELLDEYYRKSPLRSSRAQFTGMFREAAAQRLMQSLGAYGFLGLVKGLSSFLAHIPSALDNLIDAAERSGSLPNLLALACQCKEASGLGFSASQ